MKSRKALFGAGLAVGLAVLVAFGWWLNEGSLLRLLTTLAPAIAGLYWLLVWKRQVPGAEGAAERKNEAVRDAAAPEERG